MSKRLVNLITILIVLGGGFYAYRYFFVAPASTETAGVTVTTGAAASGSTSGEFLDLLLSVKNISLTKTLFDNPIFRDRLQDYSRELPQRTIGRENPFAPFGVGGSGTTTTPGATASSTKANTATSTKTTPTSTTKTKAPTPTTPPSAAELNQLNQDLNNLDSTNFSF